MQVYQGIDTVPSPPPPTVLTLGNFDGVHRGHQALFDCAIDRAKQLGAEAWAITFDPHPSKVLAPELAPALLDTLHRRLELMAQHGLAATVVLEFTHELAARSPEDFVEAFLMRCGAKEVVVGYDFSFGKDRAGNPEVLRELCETRDIVAHVVGPVHVEQGAVPSSSKVREFLLEGRVEAAQVLLGHPYSAQGWIEAGAGRGATIGFPTANLRHEDELIPQPGVYAVQALVEGESQLRPGAANIGINPTFGAGGPVHIEVHLIDFEPRSLEGRRMRVEFIARLRGERRFESVAALKEQIGRDVDRAREILARLGASSE